MRRRTIIATTIGLIVVGLLFRFSLMTYALYAMALAYIISVAFARTSLDGVRCARRIATDRAEIGDSLDGSWSRRSFPSASDATATS